MIEEIFADASGLIALGNEDDFLHHQAMETISSLSPFRFLTTDSVVSETLTRLVYDTNHSNAVQFGEMIFSSSNIEIIPCSDALFKEAWGLFKKYSDKEFSFVDCMSFVVMRKQRMKKVFGCDKHFEQMGFENLLFPRK